LPGIRENGGQYTHAALWVVIALIRLGRGDAAMELFHMLNPINHTRTPEGVERYRAEPYVVAADVYAHPMHTGRGGWTWYTGSAGWMYQAAVHAFLGLSLQHPTWSIDPCIPSVWSGCSLTWTRGRTRFVVTVENPDHVSRGIASAEMDGIAVDALAIPCPDDDATHRLRVVLGKAAHLNGRVQTVVNSHVRPGC
jgi:cyclic beta-1,2-glucan synthetase